MSNCNEIFFSKRSAVEGRLGHHLHLDTQEQCQIQEDCRLSTGRIPLPRGKINFLLVKIMKIPIGIKRACFQTMAGSQRSLWKHLCHFYVCRLANFLSGCSLYNSLKATSRHPLTLEKHWCTQRTLYMALVLNPKSIGAIQKERVTDIKARRQRNVVWLRDNCLTVFYGSSSTWLKRQTTAQLESNASL